MIELYSGTPGSGKSLHAARDIYWQVKKDRPIIANFEINTAAVTRKKVVNCHYVDNTELTADYLIDFSRRYFNGSKPKEGEITLYVDECQILYNSRDFQQADRRDWLKFFSQHRKYGYHVILICQFDRMLDRQIRCLIDNEYNHRNFSNFGKIGKALKLLTFGDSFIWIKYYYPCKEKVGTGFQRASRRIYKIYDTFDTFGSVDDVEAVEAPVNASDRPYSRHGVRGTRGGCVGLLSRLRRYLLPSASV